MIRISNLHPARGRVVATFTATVGELVLPGCALIRRAEGYVLSLPRVGKPSRPAPLTPVQEAELLRVAVEATRGLVRPVCPDIEAALRQVGG